MTMFLATVFIFFLQLGAVAGACNCQLTYYKSSTFRPNLARVHIGFLPQIEKIHNYAVACNVEVYITSSYRRSNSIVNGAIVTPATRSNHLIGHAIDMNLWDNNQLCNSRCLVRKPLSKNVQCFIDKIRSDSVLRWGGDFNTPDPVHIDDVTNWRNPTLWNELFNSLQNNCQ